MAFRRVTLGGAAAVGALGVLLGPTLWERAVFEPLPAGTQADAVLIEKAERRLTLLRAGTALKSYRVALGRQPIGPKRSEGDGRTPEGTYRVDGRKADSAFHRALHLSYPGPAAAAAASGVPPGGAIFVHGLRNGLGLVGPWHRAADWTEGCIAVTDREIDELWRVVPDGTPVTIVP